MPSKLPTVCLGVAVLLAMSGCQDRADRGTQKAATTAVDISTRGCGSAWTKAVAGPQSLTLHNVDSRGADVMLVEAASGAALAEVDTIGSGGTAQLHVDLGAGRFRLRCMLADEDAIDGPVVSVTGSAGVPTTRAVLPVTRIDLIPVAKAYQAYVVDRLPVLLDQVQALGAAVASGDLMTARARWLVAQLTYQTLGAAYVAFGDADTAIDGLPDGLPKGLADKHFTGFHRLEYGLWHGQPAAELTPVAERLVADVAGLITSFPKTQVDLLDIGIRAHEISEGTARFVLTGHTDFGSGSSLATAEAQLRGTEQVLVPLRPVLAQRLSTGPIDAQLARTQADLLAQRSAAGTWPALSQLSRPVKERLDADYGSLNELLSQVAEVAEPRRTT